MTDLAFPDALPPQYRMHWYTVERVLGQGGFGITYLARDTNLDQLVAIKEYLPFEVATRREDSTVRSRSDGQRERYRWGLDRFIQEARTLARFDHANIVRVYSVFEFNGTAYMVMRFEEGENLGSLLERRGTLPESDVLRILLPVLDGLELVHNAGFIHRDIKPDNIHIRADGSPVLLDFGSARLALGKARNLTILVAPGYAPFEQYYSSSENQGPWTDIYGLAATCYRAIAGMPPLDAITRSKGILGSTQEVLVPARSVGAGRYPGRLLAAVDHALEFAEKDRPQTISKWRKELVDDSRAASAAPAVAARAPERADAPAVSAPSAPPPDPVAGAAHGRAPAAPGGRVQFAWAIAGAAAGAIAIAVFLRLDSPGREAEKIFAESKQQLEQERRRFDEERKREEDKRRQDEQERRRLAEQQKQETDKRRQLEQERLAEQQRREVEKKRLEEQKRAAVLAARSAKPAAKEDDARRKPVPPPGTSAPAVVTAAPERVEPLPVVATARLPDPPASPTMQELLARAASADGRGDFSSAREILLPLARSGNAAAQVRLGEIYANGRGVPRNYNQAYIWYSLAARGGSAGAAADRDKMAAMLQPAEVKQAEKVVESMRAR